jgi:subtilisin family serine protease
MSKRHVFLKNEISTNPTFNRKRGFSSNERESNEPEEQEEEKVFDSNRINQFRTYYRQFNSDRENRSSRRTIEFPSVIDLVEISFFKTFNNELRGIFLIRYGLDVLELKSFNRTVVFEVVDINLFAVFERHINFIISSDVPVPYSGEGFNVLALIHSFRFVSKRNFSTQDEGVNLKLISSSNSVARLQNDELINYLNTNGLDVTVSAETPDIISVSMISSNDKKFLEDNFDIVESITSSRALQVRPGTFGSMRVDYGFQVSIPNNLPKVGVIDTGISNITPFTNLLEPISYDHTGQGAFNDPVGHGTLVAGLIIFGDEFPSTVHTNYIAKAKVVAIKAINRDNDSLNIPKIIHDIREEKRANGTRIFNMSLNLVYSKKYNSSYSDFAYELDKLAFEEDLIVFLSVGNFAMNSLQDYIYQDLHPDHNYPDFFYKLERTTTSHSCENTNICEPSDSLNNISVGALAGNLAPDDKSDISPTNMHPAYYTRKFHLDFDQKVNGVDLGRNQKNKNINKPDFIYEGGDLFTDDAGMEVLAGPGNWFAKTAGTSLSTPLIASLAAQVIHQYPQFNMQSVKALLLNSASYNKHTDFPEFSSNEKLYKKLIGNGKPHKAKLFNSSNESIVLVIEDKIKAGEIITMPLNLPEYLKTSGNKLKIDISLCYKFKPVHKDHLNYNPLHISFNVVKNLPISTVSSGTAADYGIKNTFSWSEDHFGLDNLIFSNSQFKSYKLQPNDLNELNGSIGIAVRCLVKNNLNTIHTSIENEFSLVIRLTEIVKNAVSNSLYDEIREINNVVDIALITDTDLELDT